jgi:hypothetical protein
LGIERLDFHGGLETFFGRAVFRIQQLRQPQDFIRLRIVRIKADGLLQLIFRGDILHLVQRNLPQQSMSAGTLAVLLQHSFSLLARLGILRGGDLQIPQAQTRIRVLRIKVNRARQGLAGSGGMILLRLQKSEPVICIGVIRIDLDSLAVFALCRGPSFLSEVLIPFFQVLPGPCRTPATAENGQRSRKQQK